MCGRERALEKSEHTQVCVRARAHAWRQSSTVIPLLRIQEADRRRTRGNVSLSPRFCYIFSHLLSSSLVSGMKCTGANRVSAERSISVVVTKPILELVLSKEWVKNMNIRLNIFMCFLFVRDHHCFSTLCSCGSCPKKIIIIFSFFIPNIRHPVYWK